MAGQLLCSLSKCLQTSEERCICVWEVRSQEMVAKLQGHTNVVVSYSLNTFVYSYSLTRTVQWILHWNFIVYWTTLGQFRTDPNVITRKASLLQNSLYTTYNETMYLL